MKQLSFTFCMLGILTVSSSYYPQQSSVTGAWHMQSGSKETVLILQDGYCTFTIFDKASKKFHETGGGAVSMQKNGFSLLVEFNTANTETVGRTLQYAMSIDNGKLILLQNGVKETWERIDDNEGALAGTWRITGRMQGDKMAAMNPGPRKTLKILSGTRFQWMAINTGTKDFFGTGGGTYTFKDGTYTEHIEFFSRDSSRVGASLSFDGGISGKVWTHKGLSSKGEPIHEEWTKQP